MPMTVRLQTEDGDSIAEFVDDEDVVITTCWRCAETGPVLARTIDPHGDTTFNRLQIPILLEDLTSVLSRATADEQAVLAKVVSLARRATAEPHLYLKFVGD